MLIDFTPIDKREMTFLELSHRFTRDDLRAATHSILDAILDILRDLDDPQITFIPDDPEADDPHAPEHERYQGWNLAHLVLHVTASSEEGAAFSSLLARGVPVGGRLRYEPDWHTYTTKAQVLQRLDESRRIRLAYLDTWPDKPHLDVYREVPARFLLRFGPLNAPACYLFGLWHEYGHLEQMRETARQACRATRAACAG